MRDKALRNDFYKTRELSGHTYNDLQIQACSNYILHTQLQIPFVPLSLTVQDFLNRIEYTDFGIQVLD